MKATLEFDMEEPHDREAHMRCVRALDLALALWDIQMLSKKDTTKENINEIMLKYDLNPDELVS
jgi:hypothetical protein